MNKPRTALGVSQELQNPESMKSSTLTELGVGGLCVVSPVSFCMCADGGRMQQSQRSNEASTGHRSCDEAVHSERSVFWGIKPKPEQTDIN